MIAAALRAFMGVAFVLVAQAASAADQVRRFYGYAYDLKTGRYLYTEAHEQRIADGRWMAGTIRYYGPDGAELGRKTLDFSRDPYIPLFRFDLPGLGYSEGITAVGERVTMTRTERGSKEKTATVERGEATVADSGFHGFLQSRFADLLAGRTVRFTILAAGSLDGFKFRAVKTGDVPWQGRKAVELRAELDSLLRLVGGTLDLTYDAETRELLEYRGLSNVHDPATGKLYSARIVYPSDPPDDAPKPLPPP